MSLNKITNTKLNLLIEELKSLTFKNTNQNTNKNFKPKEKEQEELELNGNDKDNYVIVGDVIPVGKVGKFIGNMNAYITFKKIQRENREATNDEKDILTKYVGWGGLSNVFKNNYSNHYVDNSWVSYAENYYSQNTNNSFEEIANKVKDFFLYKSNITLEQSRLAVMRAVMSEDEYYSARNSTFNAHYTSIDIVKEMWSFIKKIGYKGGNVLESSAGIGYFLGTMPIDIRKFSKIYAVEKEAISGNILKYLYPAANIQVKGFEEAILPYGKFNLVIGNPPFARKSPYDKSFNQLKDFSLHNYFIGKSILSLKKGGICMVITSMSTMDNSASKEFRKWVVDSQGGNADFLGGIRLPANAFLENADTQVTTDILIFRKRDSEKSHPLAQSFINVEMIGEAPYKSTAETKKDEKEELKKVSIFVNEYYAKSKEMMLGDMRVAHEVNYGGLYDPNELTCYASKSINLIAEISDRLNVLAKLLGNIFTFDSNDLSEEVKENDKVGSLLVRNDKIYLVVKNPITYATELKLIDNQDNLIKALKGNVKSSELVKDYLKLKKILEDLLYNERSNDPEYLLKQDRLLLNTEYDNFVKKYGFITKNKNISILREDIGFLMVENLENPTSTKDIYQKSDIFSKRIFYANSEPTKADNLQDAFDISINYKGAVNLDYIAYLLGLDNQETQKQLTQTLQDVVINGKTLKRPLAFINPATSLLEEAEQYLSGNTKEKLLFAENIALTDTNFTINVEFLRQYQPQWLTLDMISYGLNSIWIPENILKDFCLQTFRLKVNIQRNFIGNKISFVFSEQKDYNYDEILVRDLGVYFGKEDRNSIYQTSKGDVSIEQSPIYNRTGYHLFQMLLGNENLEVYRYKVDNEGNILSSKDSTGKEVYQKEIDEVITEQINNKAIALDRLFIDFVNKNKGYVQLLEQTYNDKYNNIYERVWSEPKIDIYPNSTIKLRTQQKIAIKRGLSGTLGGFLGVGVGKTYTIITLAMELKRLKLANKPLIVVQNATLEQFVASAKKAYPLAKILAPFSANLNDDVDDDDEAITKKEDFNKSLLSRKNRRKLFSKIALNDWDMIIMPQSQFNLMPDLPARIEAAILDQIQALEDMVSVSKKEKLPTGQYTSQIKQLVERLSKARTNNLIEEKLNEFEKKESSVKDKARAAVSLENKLKKQADRKVDDFIYFEHLGIDALMIDEFHAYKRIGFPTKMLRIKGIDTQGSQRTLSTMLKIDWIYEINKGERNVSGWTGTPISNTMAEMWTMTYLLKPSLLIKRDIQSFDAFAMTHCEVVSSYEMDAGGNYKSVKRLAKYKNMPELFQIWKSFAYVVVSADALGKAKNQSDEEYLKNFKVGEHIPLMKLQKTEQGMARGFTSYLGKRGVEQSRQVMLFKYILDWFNNIKSKEIKKEFGYIPLVIFGEARKSTIDLRLLPRGRQLIETKDFKNDLVLFNHNPRDVRDGKMYICAENVIKVYFDENNKGTKGIQLIFCDLYSRKISEERNGKPFQKEVFNVYDEIKKILIEKGIPANEIAIAGEGGKAKRQEMFEKLNNGVIRVCLGSTHTLGTGVNVQQKLIAVHHIDAPLRPMDFEQRNGRILRAGNENKEVEVFTYGIEKTLDAVAYKRLQIKQSFINQIMKGDTNGQRTVEDEIDDTEDFFETLSASLTGSTARIDQMKAEKELRVLRGQIEAEQQNRTKKQIDINKNETLIEEYKKRKPLLEKQLDDVKRASKEDNKFSIQSIQFSTEINTKTGKQPITYLLKTGTKIISKELDKNGKEVEKKKEVNNTEQVLEFYKLLYDNYFSQRFGKSNKETNNAFTLNALINDILEVQFEFKLQVSDNINDKMNTLFSLGKYTKDMFSYLQNNDFANNENNIQFYFTIKNTYTQKEQDYSTSPTDLLTKLTSYFRNVEARLEENNLKITIKEQENQRYEQELEKDVMKTLIEKERETYKQIPILREKADKEKASETIDLSFVFDGSMRGLGSIGRNVPSLLGIKPELDTIIESTELNGNIWIDKYNFNKKNNLEWFGTETPILIHNTTSENAEKIIFNGFSLKYFGQTSKENDLDFYKNYLVGIFFTIYDKNKDYKNISWRGSNTATIFTIPYLKNPLIYDYSIYNYEDRYLSSLERLIKEYKAKNGKDLTKKLQRKKYDGVIFKNGDSIGEIVIFDLSKLDPFIKLKEVIDEYKDLNKQNLGSLEDVLHEYLVYAKQNEYSPKSKETLSKFEIFVNNMGTKGKIIFITETEKNYIQKWINSKKPSYLSKDVKPQYGRKDFENTDYYNEIDILEKYFIYSAKEKRNPKNMSTLIEFIGRRTEHISLAEQNYIKKWISSANSELQNIEKLILELKSLKKKMI